MTADRGVIATLALYAVALVAAFGAAFAVGAAIEPIIDEPAAPQPHITHDGQVPTP
jgi:hypothetical protein